MEEKSKKSGFRAAPVNALEALLEAALIAEDKKASKTVILDVKVLTDLTNYFLITSGESAAQVKSLANALEERLDELGWSPQAIQGKQEARWILLDYGDFIVHIMQDRERSFYKLEQFWNRAVIINRENWAQQQ